MRVQSVDITGTAVEVLLFDWNMKELKVCVERVTVIDAEAANTKAHVKKVTINIDPNPIIEVNDDVHDDCKESAIGEEIDNPESRTLGGRSRT